MLLDDLQGSAVSLTHTASFNRTVCSDNTGAWGKIVDGMADVTTAHPWQTLSHHNTGHWVELYFDKIFRVNKIRLKQLIASTDYKQIKDVQISFFPGGDPKVEVCCSEKF